MGHPIYWLAEALVHGLDQVSAFVQMLVEAGEMEEVSIEVCGHQLHDSFSLSDCRHEIAFAAQLRVELDVVVRNQDTLFPSDGK
jgi:hypothetical protein